MTTLTFAVPAGTPDITGKTAILQRRVDIDPEIGPAGTASYSAPILSVAFASAITDRERYITGVIFRAVFLDQIQGVDADYLNIVEDPRSVFAATAAPPALLDTGSGCNIGSRLYSPSAETVWTYLSGTLGDALWDDPGSVTNPLPTVVPTDFAAGAGQILRTSLQPAQYTQAVSGTFGNTVATQRNAVVNPERSRILVQQDDDGYVMSLANGTVAAPQEAGTGNNSAAIQRFRYRALNSEYFVSRRGVSLLILFQVSSTGLTSIQNYNTGIGTFNRNLSVTYDRRFVVVGDDLTAYGFFSVEVRGLSTFEETVSLESSSGPYIPKASQPITALECTAAAPSLVFIGYLSSASYLYHVRLNEVSGAIQTGTLTAVSAYTGGSVYSLRATPSGYLLVLATLKLHVLRYRTVAGAISITEAASVNHGMTMVLDFSTNDGNNIDTTINSDAIAMSDDSRQIVAVSNQSGQFAVFTFDPETDALAKVTQTSLPTAITGAAHQTVHYMRDSASLVFSTRPNIINVLF